MYYGAFPSKFYARVRIFYKLSYLGIALNEPATDYSDGTMCSSCRVRTLMRCSFYRRRLRCCDGRLWM